MWEDGVIPDLETELRATNPKAQIIHLEPGGAIVCGKPYFLTAALDFTIPLPTKGDTSWTLALHADWEEQTIVAVMLPGEGVVWDLPLYSGRITPAGEITILPKWFYAVSKWP